MKTQLNTSNKTCKILALFLSFLLIFEQSGFAQVAAQLGIPGQIAALQGYIVPDAFRPLHLRYLEYDTLNNNFQLFLDKGSLKDPKPEEVKDTTKQLLNYFSVGLALPSESLWVNLRPDGEDNIIDPDLAKTDLGKVMLEADLQLKKDTARFTSPETPQGKTYWDKLYKKAENLFGSDNVTIPTLTRVWILPHEIILSENKSSAYIRKATLRVLLEKDYLKDSSTYEFNDPKLKELNEYSSQLFRELIIPKLTKDVNAARRYAPLRQVYYSLIMAQWFKARFSGKKNPYSKLIDQRNLAGLTSKEPWSKSTYFNAYQKSVNEGEYNIRQNQNVAFSAFHETAKSYFSGGVQFVVPLSPGTTTFEKYDSASGTGTEGIPIPNVSGNPRLNPETVIGLNINATDNPGVLGEPRITQVPAMVEEAKVNAPSLGAQVSNIKNLDRLLRLLNVLRKSESVPELPQDASDRDILEYCIQELTKLNLIITETDIDGNTVINIMDSALYHSNKSVQRLTQAIREWVINPKGGVKAINFQGKDGSWKIVGFLSGLKDKDTLEHERIEIKYRKDGLNWIEAHNKTVAETGKGEGINQEEAREYKAGRQNQIGAAQDGLRDIINSAYQLENSRQLERLVQLAQEYIATPSGRPEEEGRIDMLKLQELRRALPSGVTYLRDYLELVDFIKREVNIEITGYVPPEAIRETRNIIRWFPAQLANKIRVPIEFRFEKLPSRSLGQVGVHTMSAAEIDRLKHTNGADLAHTIWHELVHKLSLSSGKDGAPVVPVRVWKKIAQEAGFYGAFIGDRLVRLQDLPEDYKAFRRISYGDWVYREENGSLSCYFSDHADFEKANYNPKYVKYNNIAVRLFGWGEYWKTTPFEAVAEAGAEYIRNSAAARNKSGRFGRVADLLWKTLFVVHHDTEGKLVRYEFVHSMQHKTYTAINQTELDEYNKLYNPEPVETTLPKGVPHSIDYSGPVTIILSPGVNAGRGEVKLMVYRYDQIPDSSPLKRQLNQGVGYFIIQEGTSEGFKGLREREVVEIGRDNPGRFSLNNWVSKRHLRIERRGSTIILTDLNSTNGTKASPDGSGKSMVLGVGPAPAVEPAPQTLVPAAEVKEEPAPETAEVKANEHTVINKEVFLEKFSGLIAGDGASEARINWVKKNIESIQAAVQKGKHKSGYYPASGYDGLRVLVAYDLERLVTSDSDRNLIGQTEEMLRLLGIEPKTNDISFNDKGEATAREVAFELFGQQRTITEFYADAKGVDLKSVRGFEDGKADILHVYLATGADEFEGQGLNENNYGLVKEGGFFCFEENPFGTGFAGDFEPLIPSSLYGIFGLEKLEIIRRHPATVHSYNAADLEALDKQEPGRGAILHKAKAIDQKLAALIADVSYITFMVAGDVAAVTQRNESDERKFNDYGEIVTGAEDLKGDKEQIGEFSGKLLDAGADKELIEKFKGAITGELDSAVKRLAKSAVTAAPTEEAQERAVSSFLFDSSFELSDTQRSLRLYYPRIQFLNLGDKNPAVVIDKKYNSIVVNTYALARLMQENKGYEVFDLVIQAAIQTDILRKTNLYSDVKTGLADNLSSLERERAIYKVLTDEVGRVRNSFARTLSDSPVLPLTEYTAIAIEDVPVEAPKDDKELVLRNFIDPYRWDEDGSDMILLSFAQEMEERLNAVKQKVAPLSPLTVWELLAVDPSFYSESEVYFSDMGNINHSQMFRYPNAYNFISQNILRKVVEEYAETGKTQILNIGIVGAGYGQEPVSVAIVFDEAVKEIIKEEGLPGNAIQIKIHVLSLPNAVLRKLESNEIFYPESALPKGRERYFVGSAEKGFQPIPEIRNMISYYGADLLDDSTHVNPLELNALLLHNVLQWVRPSQADNEASFKAKVEKAFDYMYGIIKEKGIFSFIEVEYQGKKVEHAPAVSTELNKWLSGRYFQELDYKKEKDDEGDQSIYEKNRSLSPATPAAPQTQEGTRLPQTPPPAEPGGIDFRTLPIVVQSVGNLSANIRKTPVNMDKLRSISLDSRWKEIEDLVNQGIVPEAEKIKEFVQASCCNESIDKSIDKVITAISDILRLEEEQYVQTEPTLKDILIVLESATSVQELRAIFIGNS